MLILISPAKNLDFAEAPAPPATTPRFPEETAALAKSLKAKSAADIAGLMSLSDKLAALNRARYRAFGEQSKKAAILAFAGDVYRGLDAGTMSHEDLSAAQDRVRILSGLYGLLRPLDAIEPYRLEMGTKLRTKKAADLYGFWGGKIAQAIEDDLAGHEDQTVVNLASNEYFKAAKDLDAPVITPVFKEEKDGQARTLALFAKLARGMMARFAVDERLDRADGLKDFRGGGYKFQKALSDDRTFVFTRPQPPKKS
ncbi:peroxide stress protein YaaA [Parvularcula dongshanensis]|uniref:UPF0246 protein GGQ59_001490 n=1 Tax=Parvularcula dongshanensis TaxID=1173995 RepID=A0A840I1T3_9PROT|nr:peroxide stress protein YaaA [Parvularcula dongshanensis]MBB4658976.1 hypothetical protein [Parvularcula dongshanensis]